MNIFCGWFSQTTNLSKIYGYIFSNRYFLLYLIILSTPNLVIWYLNPGERGTIANIVNFLFYETIILLPLIFLKKRTFLILWLVFLFPIPLELIHIINYDGYTTLPAFSSAMDSNPGEMGEFISNYRHIFLLALVLIPLAFYSIYKCPNNKPAAWEKSIVFVSFLSLCILFSVRTVTELGPSNLLFNQKNLYSRLFTSGYPASYFYNLSAFLIERKKLHAAEQIKQNFFFKPVVSDAFVQSNRVAVLIIGETSRAHNWSLSGYPRETNPQLTKTNNLVYFANAITAATHTRESIQLSLTRALPEDMKPAYSEKSIISAYKEAGYRTLWVSNQNKLSPVDTPITAIAKEADELIFTNKDYEINPSFDEELLPIIKDKLKGSQKTLMVVHTLGSHEIYRKRYTKQFEKYTPVTSGDDYNFYSEGIREKLVNSYDNSILYTDFIISEIIRIVDTLQVESYVLYFSDHGENLLDDDRNRFGHGGVIPTKYVLDIPLLAWFSKQYKDRHADLVSKINTNRDKSVTLNGLFHTMLDLGGLTIKGYDKSLSFVYTDGAPRTVLTTEKKVITR